jgi:tetratricopeptide (TPR) repeat protein
VGQPPELWPLVNAAARLGDPTMTRKILSVMADESKPPIVKATLLELLAVFPSRVGTEAAAKYLLDTDPIIRAAAVRSLGSAPPQFRWQQLSPLVTDPVKSVRMEVAIALSDMLTEIPLEKIGDFRKLINEYRDSLTPSIDMPATQATLGNLELNLGNPSAAENAYQKALTIEPLYIPALLNLADLYRATNNEEKANPLLQEALNFAPDSGATNYSYGLSLIRQQKHQDALPYLKAATEQQDSQPRYAYVYAVALDSVSLTDKALVFLEGANEKWPNQYDLLLTQILYMEKLNLTDDILRPLSRLSKIAPNSPAVRERVKQYVQSPGSE